MSENANPGSLSREPVNLVTRPGWMKTVTSSASCEWPTPSWLVAELAAAFGPFDLDPAATASNAKAPLFYDRAVNGLSQPWKGRVFLNPPYGQTGGPGKGIARWTAKAADEVRCGNADVVAMVVPARVDTRWWREATASASVVCFLPGRLANPSGSQWPFPVAVIVFGRLPGRLKWSRKRCRKCDGFFWSNRRDAGLCSAKCRKRASRSGRRPDRVVACNCPGRLP